MIRNWQKGYTLELSMRKKPFLPVMTDPVINNKEQDGCLSGTNTWCGLVKEEKQSILFLPLN